MMKYVFFLIGALITFNLVMPSYAKIQDQALLVLDVKNTVSLPRKYRDATSSYLEARVQEYKDQGIAIPTREGLGDLPVSACAQFSKKQLEVVKKRTPGILYIVDLREESHGYLNGDSISWFEDRNNINAGLPLKEITQAESTLLEKIRNLKTAFVYQIKTKIAGAITSANAIPFPVHSIISEAKLARLEKVQYMRFPVTDHHAPSPETIEQFITFYNNLPANAHLLIHCRGGNGRSTFFMTLCDILTNGQSVSFNDIVRRQYLLGGKNLLGDVNSLPQPRLKILEALYQQITGKSTETIDQNSLEAL